MKSAIRSGTSRHGNASGGPSNGVSFSNHGNGGGSSKAKRSVELSALLRPPQTTLTLTSRSRAAKQKRLKSPLVKQLAGYAILVGQDANGLCKVYGEI